MSGQRERDVIGRLDEAARRGEHLRFVRADPENLGGHVEGGWHVSGEFVQFGVPEPVAHKGGLGGGTVIPVDDPRTQWLVPVVERNHAWALPGHGDSADAATLA